MKNQDNSIAKTIATKILENSNIYFCQNFEGNIICCNFGQLVKDAQEILFPLSYAITEEKLVNGSALNNIIIDHITDQVTKIENHYISRWGKNRAKIKLLDTLSKKGLAHWVPPEYRKQKRQTIRLIMEMHRYGARLTKEQIDYLNTRPEK